MSCEGAKMEESGNVELLVILSFKLSGEEEAATLIMCSLGYGLKSP